MACNILCRAKNVRFGFHCVHYMRVCAESGEGRLEAFGQLPLQVAGFSCLHDSLQATLWDGEGREVSTRGNELFHSYASGFAEWGRRGRRD